MPLHKTKSPFTSKHLFFPYCMDNIYNRFYTTVFVNVKN